MGWWPWPYLALVALRCLLLLSPGYVHPDEFFQGGQELFAGLLLDVPGCLIPWEFRPHHAVRSVAFPFLIAGLPFALLKHAVGPALHCLGIISHPSAVLRGRVLLYLPRVVMVALSFIQDWCILQLLRRHWRQHQEEWQPVARRTRQAATGQHKEKERSGLGTESATTLDPWAAVTLFAASWPALIFGSRPFSNTLEAILLALTLHTYHAAEAPYRRVRLGACFGLGCFVRFTFPTFALPLGLIELWRAARANVTNLPSRKRGERWGINVSGLLRCIFALALGMALAAVPMVLADSWFYARFDGRGWTQTPEKGPWWWPSSPVLCPLNALRYNASSANLATHGLHPRVTHALVNLPLLFSTPGLVAVLRHVYPEPSASGSLYAARQTYLAVVLSGLGLLSLAPHQEPRFLLPLGVPLTLLYALSPPSGLTHTRVATALVACSKAIFGLQCLVCILLFGGLHQAGIILALLRLDGQAGGVGSSQVTTIVFHKTYMPPRFLLAGLAAKGRRVEIVDLSIRLDDNGRPPTGWGRDQDTLLVTPASVGCLKEGSGLKPRAESFRVWPHLSMEEPPRSLHDMALVMYSAAAEGQDAAEEGWKGVREAVSGDAGGAKTEL